MLVLSYVARSKLRVIRSPTAPAPVITTRSSGTMSTKVTAITKRRSRSGSSYPPEARRARRQQARTPLACGIKAAIGHVKTDGHLGRNYLKGRYEGYSNAVRTAVGCRRALRAKFYFVPEGDSIAAKLQVGSKFGPTIHRHRFSALVG